MNRDRRRGQGGQATVELALLLPVVLVVVLVVAQVVVFARDATATVQATQIVARAVALDPNRHSAQSALQAFREPVRSAEVSFNGTLQEGEIVEVRLRVRPTRIPLVGALMGGRQIDERLVFYIEAEPT